MILKNNSNCHKVAKCTSSTSNWTKNTKKYQKVKRVETTNEKKFSKDNLKNCRAVYESWGACIVAKRANKQNKMEQIDLKQDKIE